MRTLAISSADGLIIPAGIVKPGLGFPIIMFGRLVKLVLRRVARDISSADGRTIPGLLVGFGTIGGKGGMGGHGLGIGQGPV